MHLTRIHAVDYGALSDASLDGLEPGLNLVFGRNEAGKSTFTALVRHVLYGFPTQGGEAADYRPPSDMPRSGSLTFADAGGSWLVERTAARRTADREARVTPLDGSPAKPELLGELTAGTNREMFRAVFGFGLDELADFDRLDSDALRARLYTAGAGLDPSALRELRASLAKESAALLAARTGHARVNDLAAELKQVRSDIAELERLGADSAAKRARLDELADEVAAAMESQQDAGTRAERLSRLDAESSALAARVAGDEPELAKARAAVERLDRALEGPPVDEPLLASAPEIEAIAAGLQVFELNLGKFAEAEGRIARTGEELSAAVASMGAEWDLDAALAVRTGPAADDEVATFGRRLSETRAAWDAERRRAADADAAAERAEGLAADTARAAGVEPGAGAADAVRERAAAVDALLASRLVAGGRAHALRRPALTSAILAAVGVAAVVAGAIIGQYLAAVLGVVLVGVAAYMYVSGGGAGPRGGGAPSADSLGGDAPSDAELPGLQARLRSAVDAARAADDARELAGAASGTAERLEAELAAVTAAWEAWLSAAGMSGEPGGVERLLRAAADVKTRRAALDVATAEANDIRRAIEAYAVRATTAGLAAPSGDPPASPWTSVSHGVRGAEEALRAARDADARRRGLLRDREAAAAEVTRLANEMAALGARGAEVVAEAERLLSDAGLPAADSADAVSASAKLARQTADAAAAAYSELLAEKAAMEAVLRDAERETRGADLRQREAALATELADALDRYAVVSVAQALLDEAQRAYEAERQPALVRRAGELFSHFTYGRYAGLAASIGEGGGLTAVLAGSAGVRSPEQLSRGTREQLYLAMRLAFIGELGETGRALPLLMDDVMVDFDDERKVHVAETLAAVAEGRQIVIFTCHEATAELFGRVVPGHTRRDLDRC